jgi:hypothetical protein
MPFGTGRNTKRLAYRRRPAVVEQSVSCRYLGTQGSALPSQGHWHLVPLSLESFLLASLAQLVLVHSHATLLDYGTHDPPPFCAVIAPPKWQ